MAIKRVFAGYYKRYDGKRIYVVRVVKDIDTGEAVVICKDASFIREGNEEYYTIGLESFCEQVNVDGIFKDKYIRQTRREVEPEMIGEVTEDGFPEPKRKPFVYIPCEQDERHIRRSRTYYEYAKDICENYRMDLRRYKLIRERKRTSVYQAVKLIKPCARTLPLLSNPSKPCLMITPICFGNAFPRGCLSAKQRMPCSRIAAQSSVGRLHSIGRLLSFCSSGTRQTASAG